MVLRKTTLLLLEPDNLLRASCIETLVEHLSLVIQIMSVVLW